MNRVRQQYSNLLGREVVYLRLQNDAKRPRGSFAKGGKNRLSEIPTTGNYGIIPTGRIMVIDVDTHGDLSKVSNQIDLFRELLKVELEYTLTVVTPSGGRHFYLRLPESFDLDKITLFPKSTLRPYRFEIQKLIDSSVEVDADIRTSAVNGYVVGPTSTVDGNEYRLENFEILPVPQQGIDNMIMLSEMRQNAKKKQSNPSQKIDIWKDDPLPLSQETSPITDTPASDVIRRLDLGLRKHSELPFHQKRAFVKTALHCCYSSDAIAKACIELEIDKDSFSSSRLKRYVLQTDIHSFHPETKGHNKYCPVGHQMGRLARTNGKDLAENLVNLRAKKTSRTKVQFGSNRVINIQKIYSAICADRSTRFINSQECIHTMMIVENLFHPLMCAGAEKIITAQTIAQDLSMTRSQFSRCLRILRQAKVIQLAERQKTGLASSYHVNRRFIDLRLTKLLLYAKIEYGKDVIYSHRSGLFYSSQGEIIYTPPDIEALLPVGLESIFSKYSASSAFFNRYLSQEG